MSMDRSWIKIRNRMHPDYKKGVEAFLEYAYTTKKRGEVIKCPCTRCQNLTHGNRRGVYEHIMMYGFLKTYSNWVHHGEESFYLSHLNSNEEEDEEDQGYEGDDLEGMAYEAFGVPKDNPNIVFFDEAENVELDKETRNFYKLLQDASHKLYPGCEKSLLSFILRLLQIKSMYRWSNNSFSVLLEILKETFPMIDEFPSSYREAWKIIKGLGLEYKKIHACPNDCMLYWKETANETRCNKCSTSRYKTCVDQSLDNGGDCKKIPAKVVRYFPLKPRLQRMFMCSETSPFMRWHAEGRVDDGGLRHPADSLAWKAFDQRHPSFASDSRNVRLGLATDGFNPFKSMSVSHSTWPVILVPYNLPPGMCMQPSNFMLCLLIDGPRAPGNDIDVFLQPLIEELNDLWGPGLPTYDASRKEIFTMRAALMWTISDLPGLGNVSGWNEKTRFGCPCCGVNTHSKWLKHGKKYSFRGHRRFLDENHKFRDNFKSFDGNVEYGQRPTHLYGDDLLNEVSGVITEYGKTNKNKKRRVLSSGQHNWKKKSILFDLPYWKDNLIRHNLDIMHIEKNVCDNILFTILGVKGKSKDNLNARLDLQNMGIRKALHPKPRADGNAYLPPTCFTMSKKDKDIFCKILQDVKMPDGCASNISRCVRKKGCDLIGLKSHDSHIMMELLLPIAVRKLLPENVSKVLIELGNNFRRLYSKVSRASDFEALEDKIALTLCHLEKIFPPSFFDIMEHLVVHLAEEAKLGGPAQYRTMFSIERYFSTIKSYVRTKSRPEGSIAEGYLVEECMTFCSRYLHDVESRNDRAKRNYEGYESICKGEGRVIGGTDVVYMDEISWIQAHRYVLGNSNMLASLRKKHLGVLDRERPRVDIYEKQKMHNATFYLWLKEHVKTLERDCEDNHLIEQVKCLARGPDKWAKRYSGYIINGLRYHTKEHERGRKTQNSGILLSAVAESFSSRKDKRPISSVMNFYGILTDIIELHYSHEMKYVLFKCDWADTNVGIKEDVFNYTLVNFKHLLYKHNRESDEPYILASQAQQVWYVQDPFEQDWHIAMRMIPRDLVDMRSYDMMEDVNEEQSLNDVTSDYDEDETWIRTDMEGIIVNAAQMQIVEEINENEIDNYSDEDKIENDSEEDEFYSDDDDGL